MSSLPWTLISLPSLFEWAGLIVSISALLFATKQYKDAHAHSERMKEILDRFDPIASKLEDFSGPLDRIAKSLTTQFVGLFPKNLDEIVKVVSKTNDELFIMADFVGYGHYSHPDTYDLLLASITRAIKDRDAKVHMLVYSDDIAMEHLKSQFKADEFEAKIRKSSAYDVYFRHRWKGLGEPANYQEFLNRLLERNREFRKLLLDEGVQILHVGKKLLFFLWLEDNQDAVIAFQNSGGAEKGFSFHTMDGNFILTFRDIFVREWNQILQDKAADAAFPKYSSLV
jgi:hypothetical protein